MGTVRKKRLPTPSAIAKERTKTCPKTSGLAQKDKSPDQPRAREPEDPRNTEQAQQASSLRKGKEVARQELPIPADASANENTVPFTQSTINSNDFEIYPELIPHIEAVRQLAARN
ncbi:hypothetical protein K3495_g12006 [Podosphaera aphanis]|nr:hypothetical protein K3495_g12006 [Podosphaera aphanis]